MSGRAARWISAEAVARFHELGVEYGKITRQYPTPRACSGAEASSRVGAPRATTTAT